eukprot:tig00000076_g2323.t1
MEGEIERFRRLAEDATAWQETGERRGVLTSRRIDVEEQSSSLTCVRGVGVAQACPERVFPIAWQPTRWKEWSRNLEEASVVKTVDPHTRYVYTKYAGRFPVAARDMVTLQTYRHYPESDTYVIFCKSLPPDEADHLVPEEEGVVRAEVFQTGFVIKPFGSVSAVTFISHADFKGWIPLWFQNLVAGFQPLIVQKIAKAAVEGALVSGVPVPLFSPSASELQNGAASSSPAGLKGVLAPAPRAGRGHALQRGAAQAAPLPVDADGYVIVDPADSLPRPQSVAA